MDDRLPADAVKAMELVAATIDAMLNPDGQEFGFILLVVPFDNDSESRTSYIGNIERDDARLLMREVVKRWEQADVVNIPI
jgi:hypothetical protein